MSSSSSSSSSPPSDGFVFCIDRGGTFTDVYVEIPEKFRHRHPLYKTSPSLCHFHVVKLLSEDRGNYKDAPREAIRRVIEHFTETPIPMDSLVPTGNLKEIRMGTTVATNALLERKGERTLLLTTKGFEDLLFIGTQSRPKIFDLSIFRNENLFERAIGVEERVRVLSHTANGGIDDADILKQLNSDIAKDYVNRGYRVVRGSTGESVCILKSPNFEEIRGEIQRAFDEGIRSVAICLIHSYCFSEHEDKLSDICQSIGFPHITKSSAIMPMVKMVSRGYTAVADAYLTPCISQYLMQFTEGFDKDFQQNVKLLFMQSDGGLAKIKDFSGFRAVLSGPAGGCVGYAKTTPIQGEGDSQMEAKGFLDLHGEIPLQPALLGFDMGGTSTDVSRYAGRFDHVFENTTAGVTIQAPQLDINTVAAGGGSILTYRNGMFSVGPESAGANPGPSCYRRNGPLTITDANLLLGRLVVSQFPKIFGPKHDDVLDEEATKKGFAVLTQQINEDRRPRHPSSDFTPLSVEAVALGFLRVANEAMCRPIRSLTQSKGFDITQHTLAVFGGAGAQHCCSIAHNLGIRSVFIHRFAGILSAYGMGLAEIVKEIQQPFSQYLNDSHWNDICDRVDSLCLSAMNDLGNSGFQPNEIRLEIYLNLRYHGTDTAVMTNITEGKDESSPSGIRHHSPSSYLRVFTENYLREFGFQLDREVIVDDLRVRGIGRSRTVEKFSVPLRSKVGGSPIPLHTQQTFFEGGLLPTPVYLLSSLLAGDIISGPALLLDSTSTVVVEPHCRAHLTEEGNVAILIGAVSPPNVTTQLDAIQLAIFSHRFMSIAEQMGRTLQRTAISTNIKERLDFSCALFGPDGGLVANAPHLPVHLGAMQEAVRFQIGHLGGQWREGDVIVSNHPQAGGSHLPDITVITPVFDTKSQSPVFFVASRGHHADIGGITPGSMPPHSKTLADEGAAIVSFKLVEGGKFNEEGISSILHGPSQYPRKPHELPLKGTRNLKDNLSDLKAQVAANQKGIQLVSELISQYSLSVVQAYMGHIQYNAEMAVREMLKEISVKFSSTVLEASDFMDDGTEIRLKIQIDQKTGDAVFDFTGTSPEVYGNTNAPKAVAYSAIIYCLRCLVKREIPLNQGCLNSVKIIIPPGCILNPSPNAAVVGGNVLTSQRVVDVVLKCFSACAASQGCMNNLTFGDEKFGYYETIAGGAGAGEGWHGTSGVHTHMTNTRITDPEVLERRYPVLLNIFSLRRGSGGRGQWRGGDGVIREIEFLRPVVVNILSERRITQPYGMMGGGEGQRGVNLIIKKDKKKINLGGKNTYFAEEGERILVETPGGGGYGREEEKGKEERGKGNGSPQFNNNTHGSVSEWTSRQEQS